MLVLLPALGLTYQINVERRQAEALETRKDLLRLVRLVAVQQQNPLVCLNCMETIEKYSTSI